MFNDFQRSHRLGLILAALVAVSGGSRLAAQGVITLTVNNPSFESPRPSVFPDYTVGATGWTATRSDIPAGTFEPGVTGVTPAPVDGIQVGFANGFGGLQQVLATSFEIGSTYYFSVSLGLRSDDAATSGTAAIQLGYFSGNGNFNLVTAQSATAGHGNFQSLSGFYQASAGDAGKTIVLRLANTDNAQVIFDVVQLSVTAIPEPSVMGAALGFASLVCAVAWKKRGEKLQRR